MVEQLLDMMSNAFVGAVLPTLERTRDGLVILKDQEDDIFGPHYEIVYQKWDQAAKMVQ